MKAVYQLAGQGESQEMEYERAWSISAVEYALALVLELFITRHLP